MEPVVTNLIGDTGFLPQTAGRGRLRPVPRSSRARPAAQPRLARSGAGQSLPLRAGAAALAGGKCRLMTVRLR